jgi:hypothetical protein
MVIVVMMVVVTEAVELEIRLLGQLLREEPLDLVSLMVVVVVVVVMGILGAGAPAAVAVVMVIVGLLFVAAVEGAGGPVSGRGGDGCGQEQQGEEAAGHWGRGAGRSPRRSRLGGGGAFAAGALDCDGEDEQEEEEDYAHYHTEGYHVHLVRWNPTLINVTTKLTRGKIGKFKKKGVHYSTTCACVVS